MILKTAGRVMSSENRRAPFSFRDVTPRKSRNSTVNASMGRLVPNMAQATAKLAWINVEMPIFHLFTVTESVAMKRRRANKANRMV
jgi:hypothetical protein